MNTNRIGNAPFSRYVAIFGVVVISILILVATTNYLIDPYLSHQWDSPILQRLRPTREKLSPWGKTYAIYKYQPQVLYVGNSRTEEGLPADLKLFGGKRVFNGAISGASLGDAIAMLNHAVSISKLDTVVWGVDYLTFSLNIGNSDFDRALVADGKGYVLHRTLLDLKRSLSFDMTFDSVRLLLGNFGAECRSSLAFRGQRDEACNVANLADRGDGSKAVLAYLRRIENKKIDINSAFAALRSEIEHLCRSDIHVMIYSNPSHAITLEDFYKRGLGGEWEQWKSMLVNATDQAQQKGCKIQLFDFSGFNSVTTEDLPEVTRKTSMKNYWEVSHYRTAVGRQILARMIPGADVSVPADFGVELDQKNIDAHLLRIRSERELYSRNHASEVALLEKWFGRTSEKHAP